MKGIGLVAALEIEARAIDPKVRRSRRTAQEPVQLANGMWVAVSGVGCAAAAGAANALIDVHVSALMTFGLAGGLDPALNAGSLIVPKLLVSREGECIATSQTWRERLRSAIGSSETISSGTLLTSLHALDTPLAKAAAFSETGAVAVDMESMAVARVAASHQLPFIAVRAIVDTAIDLLPPSVLAASHAGRVHVGRLMAGLAIAPGDIAAIIRLAGRYRRAMRSLRRVAVHLA